MDQSMAAPAGSAKEAIPYSLLFLNEEGRLLISEARVFGMDGAVRAVLHRIGTRPNHRFLGAVCGELHPVVTLAELGSRAKVSTPIVPVENVESSLREVFNPGDATHVVYGYYTMDQTLVAEPVRIPPDVALVEWCFHYVGHHIRYGSFTLLFVIDRVVLPCIDMQTLSRYIATDPMFTQSVRAVAEAAPEDERLLAELEPDPGALAAAAELAEV